MLMQRMSCRTHALCDSQSHKNSAVKTSHFFFTLNVMLKRYYFQFILLRRVLNLKTGQEEEILKNIAHGEIKLPCPFFS